MLLPVVCGKFPLCDVADNKKKIRLFLPLHEENGTSQVNFS